MMYGHARGNGLTGVAGGGSMSALRLALILSHALGVLCVVWVMVTAYPM